MAKLGFAYAYFKAAQTAPTRCSSVSKRLPFVRRFHEYVNSQMAPVFDNKNSIFKINSVWRWA